MNNITLRQLRYFEALARHGHFGNAAATCAVSQPALSMQIKELEASLGGILFERGARDVRLSGFGEAVSRQITDILRSVDALGELARAAGPAFSGRLRIGVIPTVAPYLLPKVISEIGAVYPDLDIHVRETITPRLLTELETGQIDLAIVALPVSQGWLTEEPLFSEGFVLVRPKTSAAAPVPTPDELNGMRLLLLEEGHCFRDQALAFCNITSPVARDGLDGSSLSTLVQMVGAGIGITLIPEMAVHVETRSADVAVATFGGTRPKRTIGMVWRRTSAMSDQYAALAGLVRNTYAASHGVQAAEPALPARGRSGANRPNALGYPS